MTPKMLPGGIELTPKLKYRREHNWLAFLKLYQETVNEKNKKEGNNK